ncbi:MAG: hypothetical protein AB1458_02090 [Bacteroidota bacterium]
MLAFSIFPKNISTYGQEIDNLFWLILFFVTVAFVISLYVLLRPLFTNHYKKVPKARYITGEKKKHFRWITAALVLLALSDFAILFAEHPVWAKTQENIPDPDMHVAIIGRQWNWIFIYPGKDGKLYTADDLYIDEQNSGLHVPVNKTVVFDLKARDVVHSFFVAELRLKQDAIPGRTIKRWFKATETGKYDMACAEICGVLHSQMRNFLVVESQEQFDAYMNTLYEKYKTNQ